MTSVESIFHRASHPVSDSVNANLRKFQISLVRSIKERPMPSIGLFYVYSGAANQNILCRMGFPEIAEFLVIDELVDRRLFPAHRAIRIPLEVQRSDLHGECVEAQEFPN